MKKGKEKEKTEAEVMSYLVQKLSTNTWAPMNQTGFIAVVGPVGHVLVYRESGLFNKGGPSEVARLINKNFRVGRRNRSM